MFAIKAEVSDPRAVAFTFSEQKIKFYRQATAKIVGISDEAAAFLRGFF